MSENIQEITDDNFDAQVLQRQDPILVDFWAPWCQPCLRMLPAIEEIANEYKDKITICKLNTEENPNTPSKYNILGIPTLILFKAGEALATQTGALSKSQLAAFIDSNI